MHKTIVLLLLLGGCATGPAVGPANYGSFALSANPADDRKMADDVALKLASLYPPAVTRFQLLHPAADRFGTTLMTTLRTKGYGLQEYKHNPGEQPKDTGEGKARPLSFVFDQPAGTNLYRISLIIDGQILSRLYQSQDGSMAPAGAWTRKE